MTDTLALLKLRRSVPPQFLTAPGPDAGQLNDLLTIAARVPDHGKLAPWRFIVFEGAGRDKAADIVAEAFKTKNPQADADKVAFERSRLMQAPVIIAVVSTAKPHVKIPEWEQELSAGAVCMNLLVGAQAMGFGASWLTNWFSFDRDVLSAFGLAEGERMAGFIHIGTPTTVPADRERPVLADIVSHFGA
ncbi:nitroreductase family protein [Bosea sp. PAMC 26642]|uniref:nitroreductase family protein n=1 Tax=Bosea sp. (strain PAMC 26642) TaxID=1792307 RepID=UPI0007700D2D|nr:nitroreductase [Bosea sp. PAMC 26642]AMJ63565.1 NAD(P)H nitroreductase [Bosea sp. PAMC 26642]